MGVLPMVMAENAFIDMTVHGLAKYFGLSAERQQQNKFESVKDKTPKVKNFGFNAIKKTDHENPWGVDLGINFDIGLSYELPLYNVDNYLVTRHVQRLCWWSPIPILLPWIFQTSCLLRFMASQMHILR